MTWCFFCQSIIGNIETMRNIKMTIKKSLIILVFFPAAPSPPLQPQWGVPHGEQPRLWPVRHHGGGRGGPVLRDAAGGRTQAQHQLTQHSEGTHSSAPGEGGRVRQRYSEGGREGGRVTTPTHRLYNQAHRGFAWLSPLHRSCSQMPCSATLHLPALLHPMNDRVYATMQHARRWKKPKKLKMFFLFVLFTVCVMSDASLSEGVSQLLDIRVWC